MRRVCSLLAENGVSDVLKPILIRILGSDYVVTNQDYIIDSDIIGPPAIVLCDDAMFEKAIKQNLGVYKWKWIYLSNGALIHEKILKAYPYSVLDITRQEKVLTEELTIIIKEFQKDYI